MIFSSGAMRIGMNLLVTITMKKRQNCDSGLHIIAEDTTRIISLLVIVTEYMQNNKPRQSATLK